METMNEKFADDVLALLSERPALISDIIETLRHGGTLHLGRVSHERRWKNIRREDVTRIIEDFGGYIRHRHHASGLAEYAATVPFDTVIDGKGRTRPVTR